MASTADILTREASLEPQINLYREGIFWKAYQHSAYRVLRRKVGFKLKKRYIKSVSCEVISLGFPHETLERIFSKNEIEYVQEKLIRIADKEMDPQAYLHWFNAVPLTEQPADSTFVPQQPKPLLSGSPESVLTKIREFPIEQSTPMDCMIFLAKVRKELMGYGHI